MFKGKFFVGIATCLCLAGCCSAFVKKKHPESKVVRINLCDDPHTLDPRIARDPNSMVAIRMFFEGLTRTGLDDAPQLALAESLVISNDLKTYTFTLRSTNWTNGDQVVAGDFVSSWKKVVSPKSCYANSYLLYVVKNGKEIKQGSLDVDQLGVEAPDKKTLIVHLENPTPYFLELLANPIFFPVNQRVDEENSNWAYRVGTYVSNGPFMLRDWKHNDILIGFKNANYWDVNSVKLDYIEMCMVEGSTEVQLFEKYELDWAGSPLSTLPVDMLGHLEEEGAIHHKVMAETAFLRLNMQKEILRNQKLRKALALAVDRAAITRHVTRGGQLPAQRLVPPGMQLQEDPYFPDNDKETACTLFQESGIAGVEVSKLKLMYINNERTHLIAQTLQQQWNEAFGFQLSLEAVERKVYFDRLSKQDYDIAFCSWRGDFNDPVNFLEVFKYKSNGTNNTGWENSKYTELLEDSYLMSDLRQRSKLLRTCEKILLEEMPIIPIFHYTMSYIKDENLKDVALSSLGTLDFKWAYWDNAD